MSSTLATSPDTRTIATIWSMSHARTGAAEFSAAHDDGCGCTCEDDRRVTTRRYADHDRHVHANEVLLPTSEVVSGLRDMLGATLVAYLGGVTETRAVAQWAARDRTPSNATETRLRAAYQAAALLRESDSPGVVQAWFRGMNPQLGDVAPARVLREQSLDEAGPAVIAAARAFVAGG